MKHEENSHNDCQHCVAAAASAVVDQALPSKVTRRGLFKGILGASALAAVGPAHRLLGQTSEPHKFVSVYFNGGWDVLVGLDPRDPATPGMYPGIDLGTDQLMPAYQTPIDVTLGSQSTILGAALGGLLPHTDVMTVFRGVNMNTVAHAAGRAYVNTYVQPSGVVARGDSLGVRMASIGDGDFVMPNVSLGVPSFNIDFPVEYTAVRTASATQILDLLRPQGVEFDDEIETLLRAAQDSSRSCVGRRYQGVSPEASLRVSRGRVRQLKEENIEQFFALQADTPEMEALRTRYGITVAEAGRGNIPGTIAAITSQLLNLGLARSVSIQLQVGLDTHSTNWAASQAQRQEAAWNALAALVSDLREDDPQLRNTTILVHSEFARTPRINGNRGRDHWFANSMLVLGGRIKRGVFGATRIDNLGLQAVNLTTGLADEETGTMLKPEHIGATVAASVGLDPAPFRVSPLSAWIEGGV